MSSCGGTSKYYFVCFVQPAEGRLLLQEPKDSLQDTYAVNPMHVVGCRNQKRVCRVYNFDSFRLLSTAESS